MMADDEKTASVSRGKRDNFRAGVMRDLKDDAMRRLKDAEEYALRNPGKDAAARLKAAKDYAFYVSAYADGSQAGFAEGMRERDRQRRGKKGAAKKRGAPLKINPIWDGLLDRVIDERGDLTQVQAIEEFKHGLEQALREAGLLEEARREPLLEMKAQSILAIRRNRSRKKE